MKLLITGGAGFIGSNFIRFWLKEHPEDFVVNLDKLTYAGHLSSLEDISKNSHYFFLKGDICDGKILDKAFEGIDTVVHFAAESHVDRSILDPLAFITTNVLGTTNLLDMALKNKVERFHHVSCYDTQTMAFTKDGIRSYDQLKIGDLVLSLNPVNNKIEWKPIEKIIIQEYTGRMIKVKTKTVDIVVTPNHRMLFQRKKTKKLIFKEASLMRQNAINKLPKYTIWEGQIPRKYKDFQPLEDFIYILGVFIGDGIVAYQEKRGLSKSGLSKSEHMLSARDLHTGQFISLGKVGTQEYVISRSWRIFLDIPLKDECRSTCEQALTNLGINWHAQKGKSGEHIYFTSKILSQIFLQCGKGAKNKHIPRWALNLPQSLLKKLFQGLVDSDGSNNRIFFTSSKKLAQQFMELCVKLSLSPTLGVKYTDSIYQGRRIKGFCYVISWGQRWRSIIRETVQEIDYSGKVWCLKVKDNKNFLIYRNGRTLFSGNTDEVFGQLKAHDKPFDESKNYAPRTPYAASKAGADHLVRAYYQTYGLPITITNCSNNYGPYQDTEKLIPRFITQLLNGEKVPLMGKGENIRDWLYVEDHCRGIETVLKRGKVGESYCVGGEEKTNLEVTLEILKSLGRDETSIEYVGHRLGHDFRYAINSSKLRKLGWKPKESFESGLKKTIKWYLENIRWWEDLKKNRPVVDRVAQKSYSN